MKSHFFISDCDGALHDTRNPNWASTPLRKKYRYTFSRINTASQLKATLRAGENTFPGCYPLYFVTSNGGALSFDSVKENLRAVLDSTKTATNDGWRVIACEVNWEDGELICDHSGERIESAYAEV